MGPEAGVRYSHIRCCTFSIYRRTANYSAADRKETKSGHLRNFRDRN